jgi:hypothetical protein
MKKQIVLVAIAAILGVTAASAQPGGFQRRTVEERVAGVHQKLDSAFKLDAAKMTQVDTVFTNYYKTVDKAREDMMASGSTDRDAMRAKMQDMAADRDSKLKQIFTEDQMKTWKDSIEPSLRPQRGNRPPGQ